ncbi:MAG: hypothetical protein JW891_04335 [Candidatus Lokiarchaeota archaeon]|nr:hypothetical protein [Candidatus Lokiarchaeota archaeon]
MIKIATITCKICSQKFESCVVRTQRFSKSNAVGLTEMCPHCGLQTIIAEDNIVD